jgi:hypothetical protein
VSTSLVVIAVSNPIAERVSGFVLIATLRGNAEIKICDSTLLSARAARIRMGNAPVASFDRVCRVHLHRSTPKTAMEYPGLAV